MKILDRFALVIHWISFSFGLVLGVSLICAGLIYDIPLEQRFFTIIFGGFGLFSCSGLGWLARFVLVGKIHFLPWRTK